MSLQYLLNINLQSVQPSSSSASASAALAASTSQSITSSVTPSQASHTNAPMSAELEQTLAMLSSHRSVLGYLLITRGHHPSIIRHSGVVFEGEQGKRYAAAVARIVESVKQGLEDVRAGDGLSVAPGDTDLVCCP